MKYYEKLYIVHPALEGGHLQDITKSVDDILEKQGSKIKTRDNWGKKRLAYPIEKQNYGTYILIQFESEGSSNNKILQDLDHNSNILGALISRIEESEILSKEKLRAPAEEAATEEADTSANDESNEEGDDN